MTPAYVRIIQFIVAIGVSLAAGQIGSIFTMPAIPTWYAGLTMPAFSPPSWVFGPVWTVLYILMGIALYLVWSKGWHKNVHVATAIFGAQLILNVVWSFVFFGMQAPFFALIVILFLWVAILMTIVAFDRVSVPAAILLVPYLLWVSFAAYLNYGIYVLNP
ncbi:TspO and MBR [Methanoculleus sediminis]|uniref:TspO and MBR n=1 Tax=Methanoculleus sediminis TaxID=1550566 RepID=A0A0H1R036_9EURY|nr:TspO/MBR family protein [Methanoculleus sediminis]KLK88206.1 TspO and MBR [Methanoculleus sediminis]